MRHDVQLLADAGIIRGPTTTWPMSWPDIARDVLRAGDASRAAPGMADALRRLQHEAQRAASPGFGGAAVSLALADKPTRLRTFDATPREEGEIGFDAGWLGNRVAFNVDVQAVSKPADDRDVRFDGSYVGVALGNFMFSAGALERWWGPGSEGSLILSTNARPVPGISIERNYSDPFTWRVLRWLGAWRASATMGQMEGSDVSVPDMRFFAARVNFRPTRWFEFGLSRTAQWCGEGRPCGLDTLGDLLIGRDNRGDGVTIEEEPGNQMAGYDARLRSPWAHLPLAVYAQMIGEDEANGLPSKFLGLAGAELWGGTRVGLHHVHVEYSDTACSFSHSEPDFDCAYRNLVYPDGYVHRGRAIGDALDGDGRMYSAGAQLVRPSGETWKLLLRRVELNRGGTVPDPAHTVSQAPQELENIELQYNRASARGELRLGAGYDRYDGPVQRSSATRGFIEWRQGF